jgi:hypothetical protein
MHCHLEYPPGWPRCLSDGTGHLVPAPGVLQASIGVSPHNSIGVSPTPHQHPNWPLTAVGALHSAFETCFSRQNAPASLPVCALLAGEQAARVVAAAPPWCRRRRGRRWGEPLARRRPERRAADDCCVPSGRLDQQAGMFVKEGRGRECFVVLPGSIGAISHVKHHKRFVCCMVRLANML